MKILSLKPFLKSAALSPVIDKKEKNSNLLTRILVLEGHEVFILPWKGEKIWDTTKFLVSDDSTYATALPTLYLPRLTVLLKSIYSHLKNSNQGFKQSGEEILTLIEGAAHRREVFLKKAMDFVDPTLVHFHYKDPDFPKLYRKYNYTAPLILTQYDETLGKDMMLHDYVIFVDKLQREEALEKFPELIDKSVYINHSEGEVSQKYLREKYMQVYEIVASERLQSNGCSA